MRSSDFISRERLRLRLVVVMTTIVVLSVASMFLVVLSIFGAALAPELENRTRFIGVTVRSDLQRVLQLGIPLDAAAGIEGFLENAIAPFPEVRRAAVLTADGALLAEVFRDDLSPASEGGGLIALVGSAPSQFLLPVIVGNSEVAQVEIEGSPQFVQTRLRDIFLDVGVLSFVVVLIGVEVAILAAAVGIWKPYGRLLYLLREQAQGRFRSVTRPSGPGPMARTIKRMNDQVRDLVRRAPSRGGLTRHLRLSDIADMRLVLLIYIMGAEITASFLPLYGASVSRGSWMSEEFAAALPVGSFLVGVAVLSPFAGGLARRFGARGLFVLAAALTALAMAGLALADTIVTVALARGVVAVLFALASISCQQYALQAQSETRETQDLSGASASTSFYAMIFGGLVSGSALGGVVSSLFSYQTAILLGAVLVLTSAAVAMVFMDGAAGRPIPNVTGGAEPPRISSANRSHLNILIWVIGAPVAATTAVFVWYLTPLELAASGRSPAEIGRVVMLYYLMLVIVTPLANFVFRRCQSEATSIIVGLVFTAAVLFLHDLSADIVAYVVAMAVLGVGHALIRTPLLSAVVKAAGTAKGPVNVFRGVERLGGLIGLAAGSLFLSKGLTELALTSLAWLTAVGAVTLFVGLVIQRSKPDNREISE
jgi:MFS family permease